eukprot:scaffold5732_cov369-Prasinococcus_capsulatus_cf.AAC.8
MPAARVHSCSLHSWASGRMSSTLVAPSVSLLTCPANTPKQESNASGAQEGASRSSRSGASAEGEGTPSIDRHCPPTREACARAWPLPSSGRGPARTQDARPGSVAGTGGGARAVGLDAL